MSTVSSLVGWLNATYPARNWDQQCARLMWNAVYYLSGVNESEMRRYDPAKDAYRASHIESLAPGNAPPGALHYFANPRIDGHVALDVGGGLVLMTGTRVALGDDAQMLGNNYGLTTVSSYMKSRGNPYLGWSYTYGSNPSVLDALAETPTPPPARRKKKNMLGLMVNDGAGRYGVPNAEYYATYDGRAFVYVTKKDGDPISVQLDGRFANVTELAFEGYAAAAEVIIDATVTPPAILPRPKGLAA